MLGGKTSGEGAESGEGLREQVEEKKFVVYRGSVYNTGPVYPDALWVMSEYEWDEHAYHHSSNATLLARGLTREVATKMANLTKE